MLSPAGKMLAVGLSGAVVLFDRDTGKELGRLSVPEEWVDGLAFSPDMKSLAVASEKSVSVWEVAKLAHAHNEEIKHEPPVVPLEARITSRKDTYTLTLGGKTLEEFARLIKKGSLPPAPEVDLVLLSATPATRNWPSIPIWEYT